jgi:hypothetical protein
MNTSTLHGLTSGITGRRTAAVTGLLAALGAPLIALSSSPIAAAGPDDELFWYPDLSQINNEVITDFLGTEQITGNGPLDAFASPEAEESGLTPVLTDQLTASVSLNSILGIGQSGTYDVTGGNSFTEIPVNSTIDFNEFLGFGNEIVSIPGAGLFGLPDITDTIFTPLGPLFSF